MALTVEQRAALRALLGLINTGQVVVDIGRSVSFFREHADSDWSLGARELGAHLTALEIPHEVLMVRRQVGRRRIAGFELRIRWDHREAITRWVPSLARRMDPAGP